MEKLNESFSPPLRPFESYFAELGRANMERGEVTAEFGSRLQNLVRQAKSALLNSVPTQDVEAVTTLVGKMALKSFLKGLRPEIELRVSLKDPQTLDAAVELAKEYS